MADRSRPVAIDMPKLTVPSSAVGDTRAYRARISNSLGEQLVRETQAVAGAPSAQKVANVINTYNDSGLVGLGKEVAQNVVNKGTQVLFGKDATPPDIGSVFSGSGSGSGYGSGSGSGVSGTSPDMQSYIDMINQTTDRNNAWAAEQAQKQMFFQEHMSNTAHQREVQDLMLAGLNPILSVTGGNGAAALSGAMAQPDTSNTRLLAEMSLASVDALGSSAVQLASGSHSRSANSFRDQLLSVASKVVIPTLARGAARALTKGLFG